MSSRIFALDFDGVLCDSARETAHTAWRAGAALGERWTPEQPPEAYVDRFLRIRPVLETGYQAIPLMRLAVQEVPVEDVLKNPDSYLEESIRQTGRTASELKDALATTRDRWIRDNFSDWIAHHRFYPGTIEALQRALTHDRVYILTTKQEKFADALLEYAGVKIPPDNLYGLESGEPKETTLTRLLSHNGVEADALHFVEDRLPTLERTLHPPELDGMHRYLAAWGYNTADIQQRASRIAGIETLYLEDFCSLLKQRTTA